MTLTADTAELDLPAGGLVQVRSSDGKKVRYFKLAELTEDDLRMDISEEEYRRRLADPNGLRYAADEVAAKMREWRCTR